MMRHAHYRLKASCYEMQNRIWDISKRLADEILLQELEVVVSVRDPGAVLERTIYNVIREEINVQ